MAKEDLRKAKKNRNDEFYTQLSDIEKELKYYKTHFKNKTVLCNCDDPLVSNFYKYFAYNFERLRLKKLIATCYKSQHVDLLSKHEEENAVYIEYTGDKNGNRIPDREENIIKKLNGDGDFRSQECIKLLEEADIVVTNPPFSLFREYVRQLIEYNKKFLIIGNLNAITYKEIFPLIKDNKIWFGSTCFNGGAAYFFGNPELYDPKKMSNPKNAYLKDDKLYWRVNGVRWYTNLDHNRRHEELILYKKYTPELYPKYDNYNAININKVKEIPMDYDGVMGVPISFLDKYNPEQFEIIKFRKGEDEKDLRINGKCPYFRILIRNKKI